MSVLPKKLAFSTMKSRAKARQTRVSITPDSATSFNPGQNLTFRLPASGQGVYIDTSSIALSFTVKNKKDKSFALNSAASCFIARKVEAAQSVISDINEYGVLCEMIHDAQVSTSQRKNSMSITSGISCVAKWGFRNESWLGQRSYRARPAPDGRLSICRRLFRALSSLHLSGTLALSTASSSVSNSSVTLRTSHCCT
jgi:hypothetical protein